jgi:hypothetical protein
VTATNVKTVLIAEDEAPLRRTIVAFLADLEKLEAMVERLILSGGQETGNG